MSCGIALLLLLLAAPREAAALVLPPRADDPFAILEREEPATTKPVVYVESCPSPKSLETSVAAAVGCSVERAKALAAIGAVWYRDEARWRRFWPSTTTSMPPNVALRAYARPKRFREACDVDWSSRLLHVDGAFVVVDKPPMLPTQADNGNSVECLAACVSRYVDGVGVTRPAHRLDTVVGGCCCLARNRKAQATFQAWLRANKVHKRYVARVATPVGKLVVAGTRLEHDMLVPVSSSDRARFDDLFGAGPRLLRDDRDDRGFDGRAWKPCALVVEDVRAVSDDCADLTLELVTGRPHQIRAQLAAVGLPILRDSLYGSGPDASLLHLEDSGWRERRAALRPPQHPICLVAQALSFAGRDVALPADSANRRDWPASVAAALALD